jgi:hypothetical protein
VGLSAASALATTPTRAAPPRSNPTAIQPRGPDTGSGTVRPSTESDDVTRLLLALLAGLLVLVVIPMQVAKGIAERRRQAALASARARRPRRRR